MRIAINVVTLLGDRTGVGTYTRNLIRALAEADRQNEYRLYYGYARARVPAPPGKNFRNITSRIPGRVRQLLLEHLAAPIEWFVGSVDVVHDPFVFVHHTRAARRVVTLFDVIPLRFPELFANVLREGWGRRVQKAVDQADCVITVSDTSKRDIEDCLRVPAARIRVAPLAADPLFRPLARDAGFAAVMRSRLGLEGRIILNVGRLEPHKNLERLVHAFRGALAELGEQDQLVFTGQTANPYYHRLVALVRDQGLKERVRFLDYVPVETLVELVNAAAVVVIPSLWEGFGLPVLESMACGTPVITSNVGATREVADEAALLIDPEDTASLSQAIVAVLSQADLAQRLRGRGLERAARYSWKEVARRTLDVYIEQAACLSR